MMKIMLLINQYLKFETQNQKIHKGEISTNLNLNENNLFRMNLQFMKIMIFKMKNFKKKLFENFTSFWSENTGAIIKNKAKGIKSNYNIIQSIIFYSLFYFCISMIFFSKKLVDRGMNTMKIFLLVLSIFLYYLLIPKIMLNNFQYFFQIISIIIFILIFFKIKKYE